MRILIAHVRNDIVSGAEYAILDMLKEIPEGYEIEMLVPGKGKLGEFYEKNNLKVNYLRVTGPRRLYPGLYLIASFLFSFWIRHRKFDIVLCNTFAASFRVSLATKFAGKKLVIYVREYFSKKKKINLLQVKRADKIFAVSKDVQQYVSDLTNKTTVCYDTIDFGMIQSRLNKKKIRILPVGVKNIGYIGRITSYKQPDLFIKSIPLVLKHSQNVHFHVVGKNTPQEDFLLDKLKTLIEKSKIEENITLWGHRDDAIEIMSELDTFCLTSDREPFPRSILECMSIGVPVVCSNTGGCKEMIEDGITGLYFDVTADEPEVLLATRLIQILNNSELSQKLSANSKQWMVNSFGNGIQIDIFFNNLKKVHFHG